MRVAVVAGPDPGHSFPAIALCQRFIAAGDAPVLFTGTEWLDAARAAGVQAVELAGLDPTAADDDRDAGAKIHQRAARMALLNLDRLRDLAPDLVVSDVITACGGMAAELMAIPWIELNPHPLYLPSKGLPPLGSGLAPGTGIRGRLRDSVMRTLTARSWRAGLKQRAAVRVEIGLPARDPGPLRRDRHLARAGGTPPRLAGRSRPRRAAALRTDRSGVAGPARIRASRGGGAVDGVDRGARDGADRTGLPGTRSGLAGGRAGGGVAAERARFDGAGLGRRRAGAPGRVAGARRPGGVRRRAWDGG